MGTTADKLALLKANKKAIRDAITEKVGEDAGEVMSTYAEKIRGIESKPKYYRTTILLNQTITDPATMITKVYDDGGIDMIRANSHRYVCKLVDGIMQAKQLQDTNGTLYLDGSTADLTGGEGDVMMKLPKFYYKAWQEATNKWRIDFFYRELPNAYEFSDYKEWDGKDFIGVYESYVLNSNLHSWSNATVTTSVSQSNFKTYASNRGNGYTLVKWKHHCMMAFLFYAFYLNTNCQLICGKGTSAQKPTGQSDLLGMEDTVASVNGNSQSVNFWGLENWWGNRGEWIDNITKKSSNSYSVIEDDMSSTTYSGVTLDADGWVSRLNVGANLGVAPYAASASESTGFCDRLLANTSNNTIFCRSWYGNGTECGLVFLYLRMGATEVSNLIGSRLAYRGEYKIIE